MCIRTKGFTGGISDLHLDATGRFLSSASLDRYVRIHDSETTVLLYQCYVKSKATKILIRPFENEARVTEEPEEVADLQMDRNVSENKSVNATSVDNEYEDMFDQMPTVG